MGYSVGRIEVAGPGLWASRSIPKIGWKCEDILDVSPDVELCQMCKVTEVRFVHVMCHDRYPFYLRCGSICAGRIGGDIAAALERERRLALTLALRYRNWLRREWTVSPKGNLTYRTETHVVTVYPHNFYEGCWSCSVAVNGKVHFSKFAYATIDDARIGCLNGVMALLEG